MASSNNIDIKEDVKEDVMEDGGYDYIGGATLHKSAVHFLVGKIGGRYGGR